MELNQDELNGRARNGIDSMKLLSIQ